MKQLNTYINEALIKKDTKIKEYKYQPENLNELKSLIKKLLKERGKNADLNDVDVSNIIDMSWLFDDLDPHNIDISEWNVSNVENMKYMFYRCQNFDCDLSKWDVSNVKNMESIFQYCISFKGNGVENWDISQVTDFNCAFFDCKKFNKNLNNWKINRNADISGMFNFCKLKSFPKWYK